MLSCIFRWGGVEKSLSGGNGISTFIVVTQIPRDGSSISKEDRKFTSGWSLKIVGKPNGKVGMNLGVGTLEEQDSSLNSYNSRCYLKIQGKENQASDSGLDPQKIKFECDGSNYKKELGRAVCDIKFTEDTKLKWKDGFKPKLIWRAF